MELIRGNSKHFYITLTVNKQPYKLQSGETALFTIKDRKEKNAKIKYQKQLTSEHYVDDKLFFKLAPEDTVEWSTGENGKTYYWDFAVKIGSNNFYTPIQSGEFILLPALGAVTDIKSESEEGEDNG